MSDEKKVSEEKQEEQGEKKNKKINKMNLAEVEKKIEETKKHQNGLSSRYAKELLNRRDQLNLLKEAK